MLSGEKHLSDPVQKRSLDMGDTTGGGLVTESLFGLQCQSALRRCCKTLPVLISVDAKCSSLSDLLLLVKPLLAGRETFVFISEPWGLVAVILCIPGLSTRSVTSLSILRSGCKEMQEEFLRKEEPGQNAHLSAC